MNNTNPSSTPQFSGKPTPPPYIEDGGSSTPPPFNEGVTPQLFEEPATTQRHRTTEEKCGQQGSGDCSSDSCGGTAADRVLRGEENRRCTSHKKDRENGGCSTSRLRLPHHLPRNHW